MNFKKINTLNNQKIIFTIEDLEKNLIGHWDSEFKLNNISSKNIISHLATLMLEFDLTLNIEKLEKPFLKRLDYNNEFSNITRKYFMYLIDTLSGEEKIVLNRIENYEKWNKRIIVNESIRAFISEKLIDPLSLYRNTEFGVFTIKWLSAYILHGVNKNDLDKFYKKTNSFNFSKKIDEILDKKTKGSKEYNFILRELFHYKNPSLSYSNIRALIFNLGIKENYSFYNTQYKSIKKFTKEIIYDIGRKKDKGINLGI